MHKLRFIALLFFNLAALSYLALPVAVARPLTLGTIGENAADEIKKFWPFTRYLAKELQSAGIDEGKVVVAKDMAQMAGFLREAKVDLYIDSAFPIIAVSQLSGAKFLVRRWKKGIGEYHSAIFTRKDSGINRLEDLRGKFIAFEEPYSTSGYFLPKMAMSQAGLKLTNKQAAANPVAADEVGYLFSRDDTNTMWWVVKGKVAGGAMDNQNYTNEAKGDIDQLKVLHKTISIPRQIVSYRGDLAESLAGTIKQVLLRMDQSEEGKKILQEFERTTKFDELSPQALAPLVQFHKSIAAEVGK